jgi:hypothetical protein
MLMVPCRPSTLCYSRHRGLMVPGWRHLHHYITLAERSTLASSTFYITTPPSPSDPRRRHLYSTSLHHPRRHYYTTSTDDYTTSYCTSIRGYVVIYTHTLSSPTCTSPTRPPSPVTLSRRQLSRSAGDDLLVHL